MSNFSAFFAGLEDTPAYKAAEIQLDIAHMAEHAMKTKNITKAALAKELNCSRAYITKALRGDNNFSILSLAKLAEALDCEVKVALLPKSIYQEIFEKVTQVLRNQDHERQQNIKIQIEKAGKQKAKVIKFKEFGSNASLCIAA